MNNPAFVILPTANPTYHVPELTAIITPITSGA